MSWIILRGDARQIALKDNSIDAITTDPPYELGFMGKSWDKAGVAFDPATWREALRVLKPGGYLLAFGGTRTYHRLTCAIEDAGFEIRDCMMWVYGSGFPKSLDVSKAIDKQAGVEREVVGVNEHGSGPHKIKLNNHGKGDTGIGYMDGSGKVFNVTAPSTNAAKEWQGWGTALKPAWEPIIVARKPIEKNVAHNVQKYGTGALNIDECRIKAEPWRREGLRDDMRGGNFGVGENKKIDLGGIAESHPLGRWPANVILAHHPECEQIGYKAVKGDNRGAQDGQRESGFFNIGSPSGDGKPAGPLYGDSEVEDWNCHADCPVRLLKHPGVEGYDDTGAASRFFYTAKASKDDRGDGNTHPTVKPQDLMEYLLKLVARPGAVILDQFMGSGTTILVGDKMGYKMIGIDNDKKYPWMARERIIGDAPLLNL